MFLEGAKWPGIGRLPYTLGRRRVFAGVDPRRDIEAHERTVLSYERHTRTDSGMTVYYHEIHTLFEELIDRPWGVVRWRPAAEVCESENGFVIRMDLPGVKAQDLRVVAQDRTLLIEGMRKFESVQESQTVHFCERPEGKFARTFHFHHPIETEAVEHTLQEGVLIVLVRKSKGQ